MILGFQSPSAAAAAVQAVEPATKRRGVKGNQEEAEQIRRNELMDIICKLLLSTSLSARLHKAMLARCWKLLTEDSWIKVHKQSRADYVAEQAKAKVQGLTNDDFKDQAGNPSVWGTNAMFANLIKIMKAQVVEMEQAKEKVPVQEVENVKSRIALIEESVKHWMEKGGWKLVHTAIPHSLVSKMFHSSDKRLEIGAPLQEAVERDWDSQMMQADSGRLLYRPEHVLSIMIPYFKGKELIGVAPPGDLERKIQAHLDNMKD